MVRNVIVFDKLNEYEIIIGKESFVLDREEAQSLTEQLMNTGDIKISADNETLVELGEMIVGNAVDKVAGSIRYSCDYGKYEIKEDIKRFLDKKRK